MKQLLKYVVAGMIGGLVVLGGMQYLQINTETEISTNAREVSFPVSGINTSAITTDFVVAAEKSTKSVVHIAASESELLAKQRIQDQQKKRRSPFDDFFSMEDFFGGSMMSPFYQQKGSGSGVIISEDGYIVTNNHVVGFADEILVTLNDGRKLKAKKIGTDPSTDLAVIKIEEKDLPTLELADSDQAKVGEWVLAVGNPFDYLTSTVTAGIISAKGRELNIIKDKKSIEEFIQTDAAINPGNSGGALVNSQGQLIGINTAIATPTGTYAGYSFAIPSNLMKKIVDEIIENGDIERANLGVAGYDIDEEFVKDNNLKAESGFYVAQVVNGSAAQYAGIIEGDVITEVDGKKIANYEDLKEALKFTKVGDAIAIKVNRNGTIKTFNTRLRKGL